MVSLQACLIAVAVAAPADIEIIKFTASWCIPCQAMEPVLLQVAQRGFAVRRIDVDHRRDLADKHQVKSVPTLLIVSGGHVVDRIEGAIPLEPLLARINRAAASQSTSPSAASTRIAQATPSRSREHPVSGRPSRSARDPGPKISIEQLALQATVRIRVEDAGGHSFGTGTIVDVHGQDALVLTCGHIFRDSQGKGRIVVEMFPAGARTPVEGDLIRFDLKRDLALVGIRTSAKILAVPVARSGQRVTAGQRLFSVGCNHGNDPTVMRGRLNNINKYLGAENLTVQGRPTDGRSGGGLFSYDGYLIGVCNAADPDVNEGLYAAFGSVHQHLNEAKLSFVYGGPGDGNVQLAAAPASAKPRQDSQPGDEIGGSLASQSSPQPNAQFASAVGPGTDGTEVICIIRSKNDPVSKSQIMVLDRPSRDFLTKLHQEHRTQVGRKMTQMRVLTPKN